MPILDLLTGTLDGVFAVDRGQRIAFWNDGARRILGFEPDAVLGRLCYEVLGGTDESGCTVCEKRCATFSASLRGKLSSTQDVQVHASDGGRKWVSVTTFVLPARYHELSLLAHVFRDTSQVKEIEFRLERALAELEERSGAGGLPRPREPLTEREAEVLHLLASGASTASICVRLGVQTTTVRTHVQHILEKLGVHSRIEAVASASQNGLLRAVND